MFSANSPPSATPVRGGSTAMSVRSLTVAVPEGSPDFKQDEIVPAEVEVIRIEGVCFVSTSTYNAVTDKEQTTVDWIRHQDEIFLNGHSLRVIVDNLKKEYLKAMFRDFLYANKNPAVIRQRIATLRAIAAQFFKPEEEKNPDYKLEYLCVEREYDIQDAFAVRLMNHLKSIVYDLDIKDAEKQPKYHFAATAEMVLLRGAVKKLSCYFSSDGIVESCAVLEAILRDYLFVKLKSEQAQLEYTALIFRLGHQGGFLFSLFTAHLDHMDKKFCVPANACISRSRIELSCDDTNLHITESTPIVSINPYNLETPAIAMPIVEDQDQPSVVETKIEHIVTRDGKGNTSLKIVSAVDYFYNHAARDVLIGKWLQQKNMFSNYANYYIQNGHEALMIDDLFTRFPELKAVETPKKKSLFQSEMEYKGDKILAYLGKCSPSFAESVLINLDNYAEMSEMHYMRAMQLLQRMGRIDLVRKVLLPFLASEDKGHESMHHKNSAKHDENIAKGYQYLVLAGFLSSPIHAGHQQKNSGQRSSDKKSPTTDKSPGDSMQQNRSSP